MSSKTNSIRRWTANNPDNYGAYGAGYYAAENCIEMASDGVNDASCDAYKRYACELDL